MADIKPPFTAETAHKKVKAAQAAWNSKYGFSELKPL
jgi:nuclear transport factor 2 (NTF2) superfamily protein